MIGTSLSHYRITAKLGEGGMGEVYRATDDNLGRDVAIKVLPAEVAGDAERLARFRREAHLLAALNHSNIAAIHGLEEADGKPFLVLELVEGEELAERLQHGALPVDEALDIARQVAEALEEAHEHGIVHRDLKPANIKLTPEGRVKVLDFGLAKAFAGDENAKSSPDLTQSPTMSAQATQAGVILGTAAYMSPEQARGKPVGKRADIWAFGVVLCEMLTGQKLFTGETVSDVLAAVLTRDPDLDALPASLPASARGVLERCLERDPAKRMRDIGDARLEMDWSASGIALGAAPEVSAARPRLAPMVGVALLAVAVGAIGNHWTTTGAREPAASLQLSIQLAPNQRLQQNNGILQFSPDGRSLAIPIIEDGRGRLLLRALDSAETVSLEGSDFGSSPFFSPDGRWIGFIANNSLRKVPIEGGRPIELGEQRGAGGAWWTSGGEIVFAPLYSDGLFRMSAAGGEPERLSTPDRERNELGHWWPQVLPGGRHVIFTGFRTPIDNSRVGLLSLDSGRVETLVEGGLFGRYVPSGHLLYARGQRLFAIPFDLATLTTRGSAQPVLEDVFVSDTGGHTSLAVSADGTLAYVRASVALAPNELVWVDRDGRITPAVPDRHRFEGANLSPDGRHIAATILTDSQDIWTYSLSRGTLSRLTSDPRTEYGPIWSGQDVFFIIDRPPFDLQRIRFGSAAVPEAVWAEPSELDIFVNAITPDGQHLLYTLTAPGTGRDLWVKPIDGSEPARLLRATVHEEEAVTISGDGRWIAYQSTETGRPEIYVEAFPGPGERFQVSVDGGSDPVWAAESDEIFYRSGDAYWVIGVHRTPTLGFGVPQHLFTVPSRMELQGGRDYDVTPDGQRLLIVRTPDAAAPRQIDVITNWLDELKRLVPVDGS